MMVERQGRDWERMFMGDSGRVRLGPVELFYVLLKHCGSQTSEVYNLWFLYSVSLITPFIVQQLNHPGIICSHS